MERQPGGTNKVFKIRRIPYRTTKKLGRGHKINKSGSEEYKEAI